MPWLFDIIWWSVIFGINKTDFAWLRTLKMEIGADLTAEVSDRWERIQFCGTGGEYFKIWIVNIFLSILTLGIYSAWAKVRTRRYFYGNTTLDGASFEYHATPTMILKGRLIAMAVLLITLSSGYIHSLLEVVFFILLALLAPFVIWRALIFNARMSSYRNVRFGYYSKASSFYVYLLLLPLLVAAAVIGMQYFSGAMDFGHTVETEALPRGGASLGVTIAVTLLTIYILAPYIQKSINSLYFNGHKYGQGQFRARLDAWSYYLIYIKIIVLGIVVSFIVMGGFTAIATFTGIGAEFSSLINTGESELPGGPGVFFSVFVFLPLFVIVIWFKAYATSRFRNYSLSKLKLDSTATFRSKMSPGELFRIQFSNLLLLVFTIGLAYPWTFVRLTRYKLQTLSVHIYGDVDQYVTQMQARQSALGEEIGEAFDLDLDLGI